MEISRLSLEVRQVVGGKVYGFDSRVNAKEGSTQNEEKIESGANQS
ncbi:MAG: hypothetical protein ACREVA_06645 [Burkholderiales bacterium]